jgi:thioredoxin reductase
MRNQWVMESAWECVVVGGGAAGLSAALVLGRARRRTLVIDAGEQSNLVAHGIGGLLGHDQRPPAELYVQGRHELSRYPSVELCKGRVVRATARDEVFELELEGGEIVRGLRVLLATGMDYRPPGLPGLAELWGNSVFQCPFCHGWEVRDRPLAALAPGEKGLHAACCFGAGVTTWCCSPTARPSWRNRIWNGWRRPGCRSTSAGWSS